VPAALIGIVVPIREVAVVCIGLQILSSITTLISAAMVLAWATTSVVVRMDIRCDVSKNDNPRGNAQLAYALNIPAGQWHTLRALESGTVILEMKDGAYEPIGAEDVMENLQK
jgi:hypothetical protein